MTYEAFRQFADSWGLLYLFIVFFMVLVMVFLPGAKKKAQDAANIPLRDDSPLDGGPK